MSEIKGENLKVFVDGKCVARASNVTIHPQIEKEPEQEPWQPAGGYSLTGTLTMSPEDADKMLKTFYSITHFTRKEKRRMFKILEQGYLLVMYCNVKDEPRQNIIDSPRYLRKWFRMTHNLRIEWSRSFQRHR